MIVGDSFRRMPEAEQTLESITRINAELERAVSPHLMTEKTVESCWSQARQLKGDGPSYWLLLVRLTEAALLCAGNYADNCEYEAAGDFLVNPREILVHRRGDGRSTTKNRHGRLSEQFGLEGVERHRFNETILGRRVPGDHQTPVAPAHGAGARGVGLHIPVLHSPAGGASMPNCGCLGISGGVAHFRFGGTLAAIGGIVTPRKGLCRIAPVPVRCTGFPSNRGGSAAKPDGAGLLESISG